MTTTELQRACEVLEEALSGGGPLPPTPDIERLLRLAVGAAAMAWEGREEPAFELGEELSPTPAARVAGALLHAADIELFEFALWQMWGVNPREEARQGV